MLQETHLRTRSAITKYHRVGILTSRYLFLQVQRLGDQGASNQQIQFLVRALFLACTQPSSCSVFSWSVCENGERGKAGWKERERKQRKREKGKMSTLHFLWKYWPHLRAPSLGPHPNRVTAQGSISRFRKIRGRTSAHGLGEGHNSRCISMYVNTSVG